MRVLELPKSNRAQAGTQVFLRWKDGRFVRENRGNQSIDDLGKAVKAEDVFLKLLRLFNLQKQTASPNRNQTYAPQLFY